MKVLTLNHSDINGGAARAAYRIHHALRSQGVDSQMLVNQATAGDWTVTGPSGGLNTVLAMLRSPLGDQLTKTLKTTNPILHSPAAIPSRWHQQLNQSDADVVHLHWINFDMMSIADIGHITKPIVWTLHDMWAFCGAEHYTEDYRWRDGYTANNRPAYESGFDLNRWTAARKHKHWQRPMHIVTPSRWLSDCARQSVLMRNWPVTVVPNTIDTDLWQPVDKAQARQMLHLPPHVPLLLFGAMGGGQDPRKGFDLLQAALNHLRGQIPAPLTGLQLVVFGQLAPKVPPDIGYPVHYTGHLHDDVSLRLLYSAADAIVVPSRQEAFGQTGSEAHACGTPVVAFDATGLQDIVSHQQTGYLAKAFDATDLADGIQWVLADPARHAALCHAARAKAVALWSPAVVAGQYQSVYRAVYRAAMGQA
ncbi:MAG: glycosyl transferase [Comamonadaceae bacterium CG_4_10_14_3_um_filter_60_42]|nr:MAG: glycosyl transferase [Comamonadaceae bacterium CG_4_10_14_3_um_filter_60_42]